jgi:hypothetical protein
VQNITPENARSWRDLADELTPGQIDELEREERTGCGPGALRYQARHYAQAALGDILLGNVEAPAEATEISGWETGHYADGRWVRVFTGTVRKVGAIEIRIFGEQCGDGTVKREVNIYDEYLNTAEARLLAAALVAAADEIDGKGPKSPQPASK